MALARRHGVDLIGGDTTRGPLNICVQIMGEVPRGRRCGAMARERGDDIWVSGTLGDAALALAALQTNASSCNRARNWRVPARLRLAACRASRWGWRCAALRSSAIDVSDGLLADLGHILERSQRRRGNRFCRAAGFSRCCAAISTAWRPAARCWPAATITNCALPRRRECARASSQRRRRAGVAVTRIGRIKALARGVPQLVVRAPDGAPLRLKGAGGYDHFG